MTFVSGSAVHHPVSIGILIGIGAALAVAPLIFLALGAAGRLNEKLHADLWSRWKSWLVLAPLMTVPIFMGRLPAIVGVGLLGIACNREFGRATGLFRHRAISVVVVLGICGMAFAAADRWIGLFNAIASLTVVVLVIVALFADDPKGYIQRVALGVFAFVLFGVSLGHFAFLANDFHGAPLMLSIILAVEANDIFAYCSGKLIGRIKFVQNTSPNKTLGGALGALVLTTALFGFLMHAVFHLALPHLIALGVILSLAGQCGDLVMSSIKRDLGIKDMGATIPGHGGLLDRFDSLLFVGPAVFHYLAYIGAIDFDWPWRVFTFPGG